jgi:alcohol dehydrogenase (cytochrome c)
MSLSTGTRTGCLAIAAQIATPCFAQTGAYAARQPELSADELVALPTGSWPTNGGNVYNQRYSPLAQIDRGNVAQLKGMWRARLRGSGTGTQFSGEAQPIVYDGTVYVSTGEDDVFAVALETGEILWEYAAQLDPDITSPYRAEILL